MSLESTMVKIGWLDSGMVINQGWITLQDALDKIADFPDIMHAETVGYMVHEDENVVIIAQTLDMGAGVLMNAQVIAKDSIYERKKLR